MTYNLGDVAVVREADSARWLVDSGRIRDEAAARLSPCGRCDALLTYFSGIVDRLENRVLSEMSSFKASLIMKMKAILEEKSSSALEELSTKINDYLPPTYG